MDMHIIPQLSRKSQLHSSIQTIIPFTKTNMQHFQYIQNTFHPACSPAPSIYQLPDKSGTCRQYLTLWKEWYPKNRLVWWKWIAGSHFTYKHTANVTDWSQNNKSATTTHCMNRPTSHVTFSMFPDTVSLSTVHLTHTKQGKSVLNSYHPFDLI